MTSPNDRHGIAEVALALINQHMSDCGARYAELRRDSDVRHNENVRRLDAQDAILTRILWLLFTVAGALILGLASTVGTLIHYGGHL